MDDPQQTDVEAPRAAPVRLRYSAGAIFLHWLIALLVVALIVLGWRMDETEGRDQFVIFQLHKSLGITVLLLTLVRIGWRMAEARPPPLAAADWERLLARLVHFAFYFALIALPLSGWIAVSTSPLRVPTLLFDRLPWPDFPLASGLDRALRDQWHASSEFLHEALGWLLYLLLFLHVAGALKHHFADEGPSLARMAPGAVPKRMFDTRLVSILLAVLATGSAASVYRAAREAALPASPAVPTLARADVAAAPPPLASAAAVADASGDSGVVKPAQPVAWTVGEGSTIAFRTTWSGSEISGGFKTWSAAIAFSPDALDGSSVKVAVDIASGFGNYNEVSSQLPGELWFDAAKFPQAVFSADRFERIGDDRYSATGTLMVKGVSRPLSFPFTLRIDGDQAVMDASIGVDRTVFGVGTGQYADTATIPANVALEVRLTATRRK